MEIDGNSAFLMKKNSATYKNPSREMCFRGHGYCYTELKMELLSAVVR